METIKVQSMNLAYDDRFVLFKEGKPIQPDVRTMEQMKQVIMDKEFLKEAKKSRKLYYIYRDVHVARDYPLFMENKVRYDITIIPSGMLGKELVKTKGHYHPMANGLTYPEVYEILQGTAHFLLQKKIGEEIKDVVVVHAKQGDVVIVPPNYGHITINPTTETLVMANLVSPLFSSIYEPIGERGGGAYFETEEGFVKNDNYKKIPKLREETVGDEMESDIYLSFTNNPKKFQFLNKPEKTPEVNYANPGSN